MKTDDNVMTFSLPHGSIIITDVADYQILNLNPQATAYGMGRLITATISVEVRDSGGVCQRDVAVRVGCYLDGTTDDHQKWCTEHEADRMMAALLDVDNEVPWYNANPLWYVLTGNVCFRTELGNAICRAVIEAYEAAE